MAFDDQEVETELLLLTLSEVFVYKIPALQGSAGHRAFDWNLDKPALTGQLKVFSAGEEVTYLRIYHKNADGESKMFAECPVRLDRTDKARPQAKLEFFFESVTDSSRYFVVRVEDRKTKKHIYLGIGFSQRQDAFDLRAALDDQMRRVSRMHGDNGSDLDVEDDATAVKDSGLNRKLEDMTLKEGQTIKINIGSSRVGRKSSADKSGGGGSLLAPPPPPSKLTQNSSVASTDAAAGASLLRPTATSTIASPTIPAPPPAPASDSATPAPIAPAVTEVVGNFDDDDDDFGDFQ